MCDVPGCRDKKTEIIYYDFSICDICWERHCNDEEEFNLKIVLDIQSPSQQYMEIDQSIGDKEMH